MKKTLKLLLSGIALLSTAGCINQPPPSTLALWEKRGDDQSTIGQTLLKCGWKPVYAAPDDMNSRMSEFASIYECMTKAGYRYKLQDSKGIYFSESPRSDSLISNLMIAGYQQFMDNDNFGVTNATKQERVLLKRFENAKPGQKRTKALQK
ncbi:hypothetical protein [Bartonella doshiae]|uniref:Lipoprotein n=4 Tax=Bartonella doshiae TaxID=33044 RepID=A0A380ZCK5_BARDO|nr:hypothetical protein [Bartonella doshiae]EJF79750.1 hypothetical protein MCS_01477 [Bartonella doshiae NCTC 12862 = ATCC 700133]SUV44421.1 Uncharacterised protein [Bartonella doshiae]SUV46220.1 Uncharacterised protein [Bartonella doshiae]